MVTPPFSVFQEAKTILGDKAPEGSTRAESAAISSIAETSSEKREHEGAVSDTN